MKPEKFDFSGYVTKYDVKCTDGRTIRHGAFQDQDGTVIPLSWQHGADDPTKILGHVYLEHRDDGVYGYAVLNESVSASNAKGLVHNKAIDSFSIFANKLVQVGKDVMHGIIREASLIYSGAANPGAKIDFTAFAHGEYLDESEMTEAFITSGETFSLSHEDDAQDDSEDEELDTATVGDVLDTLTPVQKAAVGYLLENSKEDDETDDDDESAQHSDEEPNMKKNVFEGDQEDTGQTLTHADFETIVANAQKVGSFREAFLAHAESLDMSVEDALMHAGTYGLDNIGVLFPDAQNISGTPEWVKRDTGWVGGFMSGTRHTPFSRIKTMSADITADNARAKGYVTGNEKKEEVFALLKRETTPTTVYKKQKLDRDDILDITSFDVVAWLRAEMRMMLDEEIARAGLLGDGRTVEDEDKIAAPSGDSGAGIRPIYTDAVFYTHRVTFEGTDAEDYVDEIVRGMAYYKGSGNPNLYATQSTITDMLLIKDTLGHRIYKTKQELAAALGVVSIIQVEVMEGVTNTEETLGLHSIVVNPRDYTFGADKGGDVNAFDDFDIDYNQFKYLIETRCSGALTKPKSALVFEIDLTK